MAQTVEDALLVRMEASLAKFERQMERGRAAAEKSAVQSEKAWQKSGKQIEATAVRAATGLQRLNGVSSGGRFVLQNTANQIGDIAVQMGAGTSASRALGQQLPQLLGGFSALGGTLGLLGPVMGTVAALALPLGAAFLAVGGDAKNFEDQVKETEEALNDLREALKNTALSTEELEQKFGRAAASMRSLFDVIEDIRLREASREIDALAQSVQELYERPGERRSGAGLADFFDVNIFRATGEAAKAARDDARRMTAEFLAAQEALAMAETIDDNRVRLDAQIAATERLLAVSIELANATGGITAEEDTLIGKLSDALQLMIETRGEVDKTQGAAFNLFKAFDQAVGAIEANVTFADSLYGKVSDVAAAAWDYVRAMASVPKNDVQGGRGSDPRQFTYTDEFRAQLARSERRRSSSGGRRGGGGVRSIDDRVREAARIYDQTRTAAEKYSTELERLNQLRDSGFISEDTHMRAVQQLGEQFNQTAGLGRRMGATISEALSGMVADFDNAKSAASDLARTLAQMAARSALGALGVDDFFANLFPSAKGNVIAGGRIQPFANGGVVSSPVVFPMRGGAGLMGEAGPEAIMPLARIGGKLGVRAEPSASGGAVDVRVYVDQGGNWQSSVERISGNVAARAVGAGMAVQDRKTAQNLSNYTARKG